MNIFSVLDVSDNEEEVKQKPVKKAKETKPEPVKEAKPTPAPKRETKPQQQKPAPVAKEAPAADPEDAAKENTKGRRGGKTHKHGEKQHGKEGEAKKHPKRDFDRKSANGRGKEVSKDGRGPYGLGNVKQEAQDAEKNPDAVTETVVADEAEAADAAAAPEEVVETSLSYEEFLRKREEARASSSLLAPAKATRVVDAASIVGQKAVDESGEQYIAPKSAKGTVNVKKDQRSTGKSQIVDVSFKFEAASNEFRRRDDNRGGRGDARRPRSGGAPAGKPKAPATVFNSGDFPSL